MIVLDLLILATIVVLILDIAGFNYTIKQILAFFLSKYIKRKVSADDLKINICTLCFTFWAGLFFLIYISQFTLVNIMVLLLIACSTPLIKDIFYLVFDTIQTIIYKLSNMINHK